ncbi:MAG: toll/interleukin-1 receptor domain-containing protein [Pseudomonadota bacterium]
MSQIFVSYAREDKKAAQFYSSALEAQGYSVWWDPKTIPGENFNDVINRELNRSKCVLVLWSANAITSRYVKDEANIAHGLNKLVSASIDNTTPEEIGFPFHARHIAAMPDWERGTSTGEWAGLLEAISILCGPPELPESGFDPDSLRQKGITEFPGDPADLKAESEAEIAARQRTGEVAFNRRLLAAGAMGVVAAVAIAFVFLPQLLGDADFDPDEGSGPRPVPPVNDPGYANGERDDGSVPLDRQPAPAPPDGIIQLSERWNASLDDFESFDALNARATDLNLPDADDCAEFVQALGRDNTFERLKLSGIFEPAVWVFSDGSSRLCTFSKRNGEVDFILSGDGTQLDGRQGWVLQPRDGEGG